MKSWLTRSRPNDAETTEPADLRAAYERGRRDERARRHKRPVLGLAVAAAALVGGAALALAAFQGSFQDGGAVMDHQIASAADHAEPVLRDMADEAGDAFRGSADSGLAGG